MGKESDRKGVSRGEGVGERGRYLPALIALLAQFSHISAFPEFEILTNNSIFFFGRKL